MTPGMIEHAVFILGLFVTESTVIICFGHHFATDLALFLCMAYGRAEFFLNVEIGKDGEKCRLQDSFFAGVWQTISLQHLLLKFLCLGGGFLGHRGLQFCRVKHFWGPKQLRKHVEQDLTIGACHCLVEMIPSFSGVVGCYLIKFGTHADFSESLGYIYKRKFSG